MVQDASDTARLFELPKPPSRAADLFAMPQVTFLACNSKEENARPVVRLQTGVQGEKSETRVEKAFAESLRIHFFLPPPFFTGLATTGFFLVGFLAMIKPFKFQAKNIWYVGVGSGAAAVFAAAIAIASATIPSMRPVTLDLSNLRLPAGSISITAFAAFHVKTGCMP